MLRVIGAALVWCGCAVWGLRAAAEKRGNLRLLEDLVGSLEVVERELTLNRTALPELMKQLSSQAATQSRQLFTHCADSVEAGKSFLQAWTGGVDDLPLSRENKSLLLSLGQVLGRYEDRGQGDAVARIRRELEGRLAHARQETQSLGNVYTALGAAAGGFLALTLI